ncbi:MAG: QueT transporter family protein [Oscillospiraceae bacterium]|nr:QueT transporter family protein [Oscillospiraceae bacterium]
MSVKKLVFSAVIAAAYAALTLLLAPISFAAVQLRVSEALCVLPFFVPSSMWGLFVGCVLANLVGGFGMLDIVFGSLATLLAAYLTSKTKSKALAPLPSVLVNAVVVGAVIAYSTAPGAFWVSFPIIALQVGAGQLGACYGIGLPLMYALERLPLFKRLSSV